MKFTIDKHSFEKDDICTCKATYYDKKKKLVYTTDKLLYCEIRGLKTFKSHSKDFNKNIKGAVSCKIKLIKKIGSKAINYDN